MATGAIDIRPSGGGIGAFVNGIDLSLGVGANTVALLREALGEHCVLFFRGQSITPEQHIAFAESFGAIDVNRFFTPVDGHPQIAMVLKEPDQKSNIGNVWHADHSYDRKPAMGSVLLARETPPSGGDTLFANMYAAYEALSDGLKQTLDGLRAVHSSRHVFGPNSQRVREGSDTVGRIRNQGAAQQDSVHPVAVRHPISGRKALYVNSDFTVRFDGWSEGESKPLLNYLYAHGSRPEFCYRFAWAPGSIAFWDNRASWHYAVNDYQGQRRLMHRVTIAGEALSAA